MKRVKKALIFAMSFGFVLVLATGTALAATYKDVSHEYWAYEDIQFIAKHEVIRGFSDGSFKPGLAISRKDAAVMMGRAIDLADLESQPKPLKDMQPTSPNYQEVMIAIERGWLTLEEDNFNPDAPLTRDEMSRMIATAYSYEGKGLSSFKDVSNNDEYYPFIDAIAFQNVTTGYNDGTFRPNEVVTRAQFSAFLARVYQKPIAYEVKSAGQTVAIVSSVEDALDEVNYYEDGTIHPQSNKFVEYAQTIATDDKTNLNSGVLIYNGYNEVYSGFKKVDDFTPQFFNPYMKSKVDGADQEMFDTFVVLGLRYNEAGNQFVDVPTNDANYSDWDTYVKRTFANEGALNNLNESAKFNNRVVDVYVAIPYPKRNGDIIMLDGQEQPNTVYSRYDLASWYITNVLNGFKQADYKNLNFKGFYWLSETVRTVEDEVLISSLSSLMTKHEKFFIYSPHATSTNFHKWKDYGFDAAFLQPNAFRTSVLNKEERLHRAFLNAQIYGTGITIEIDSYGAGHVEEGRGVEEFKLYMNFAKRYGLDEKGMMFYQGTNMVERMATIDHPVYKSWYEQLTNTFFKAK
ncbi:DUF4855 domain-containing protein [Sporosarcina sp. BP05]|uniref:DUF4855 domain-containing protein n=1 Tax=Sporosarcina sp. BP05 TaxID=2758726 RepID=UPI0016471740|nr:DUF4855 domain-containing protein [Sporosarcina sp. BP05]